MTQIKQILVVRKDLNMRKGKIAAQCCHASMSFLTRRLPTKEPITEVHQKWLDDIFTKICVSVDSEQELLDLFNRAKELNIEAHLVTDNGRTEFHGVPTVTCLALGPDYDTILDPISGHLKLL
jgi:PTH2 family peptidyl-tRNA hydrolase